MSSARRHRQVRWMKREREKLEEARARCSQVAKLEGKDADLLWMLYLDRRNEELDCRKAEVVEHMAQVLDVLEAKRKEEQ